MMFSMKRRKHIKISEKLKILEFAKENGVMTASREFGYCDSNIYRLKRELENIKLDDLKPNQKTLHKGFNTILSKILDKFLLDSIYGLRSKGIPVSGSMVRVKALMVANDNDIPSSEFKASSSHGCKEYKTRDKNESIRLQLFLEALFTNFQTPTKIGTLNTPSLSLEAM